MSWLDNVIAWFSPQAAAKREAWRQYNDALRNYDAGDASRLNSGWRVVNESGEATDGLYRDTVRARSRDLERNSDLFNAVLRAYRRNVIGSGYTLQARSGDETINSELESLWKQWCRPRNCDVTGQQSLTELLRMAVERKKVDGGILIHKVYTAGGVVPFKLQMIEVDELDSSRMTPKNGAHRVVNGIEFNRYNRPVGYWIRQYSLDGFSLDEPVYVKANDMIFYWSRTRPSQIREMSDMAPTVTRIRDLNEFINAVSVKERIQACLSVFIKKIVPSTGSIGRGAAGQYGGTGKKEYDGKMIAPGMIRELNAGDEIQVINPSGQSADATNFTKLQQRLIGAGQGVSYEAVSRDMSETNYSSARQGMIEDELTYEEEVEKIMAILDEIYESFVVSAVLAGKIMIPDFWDRKDTYFGHEWIKAPKKWIDPEKESNANKTAMQTGQKTFKEIAAERGRDWQAQIDDMADVMEYARSKGLDLSVPLFGVDASTTEESTEVELEESEDE